MRPPRMENSEPRAVAEGLFRDAEERFGPEVPTERICEMRKRWIAGYCRGYGVELESEEGSDARVQLPAPREQSGADAKA